MEILFCICPPHITYVNIFLCELPVIPLQIIFNVSLIIKDDIKSRSTFAVDIYFWRTQTCNSHHLSASINMLNNNTLQAWQSENNAKCYKQPIYIDWIKTIAYLYPPRIITAWTNKCNVVHNKRNTHRISIGRNKYYAAHPIHKALIVSYSNK